MRSARLLPLQVAQPASEFDAEVIHAFVKVGRDEQRLTHIYNRYRSMRLTQEQLTILDERFREASAKLQGPQ